MFRKNESKSTMNTNQKVIMSFLASRTCGWPDLKKRNTLNTEMKKSFINLYTASSMSLVSPARLTRFGTTQILLLHRGCIGGIAMAFQCNVKLG
jgi:hypothetical protein